MAQRQRLMPRLQAEVRGMYLYRCILWYKPPSTPSPSLPRDKRTVCMAQIDAYMDQHRTALRRKRQVMVTRNSRVRAKAWQTSKYCSALTPLCLRANNNHLTNILDWRCRQLQRRLVQQLRLCIRELWPSSTLEIFGSVATGMETASRWGEGREGMGIRAEELRPTKPYPRLPPSQ